MYSLHDGAVLLVLAAAVAMLQCDAAVTCLDEEGKPVDWFIVYKLPIDSSSSIQQVQEGYGYMYMDVRQTKLKLSNIWLNATNHAIAHTLQQIYDNDGSKDVAYLMYNDELPDSDKTARIYGHTKGDLAFDASSGFWLVHSTPRFPRNSSLSYNWPNSARRNGQSFLCVTFGFDQFEEIGQQLMYNYPWVYDSNLPSDLVEKTPSIVSAANKKHVSSPPWNRSVSLTSSGGQSFTCFAKSTKYGEDIYSSWLAPYLKSDIFVETWQDGRGKMNSSCGGTYKAINIVSLKLGTEEYVRETKDHSKWAVTASEGSKWICIGDINRMCSQLQRGGGTLCFENEFAHRNFLHGITASQKCPQVNQC
ncbi:plancitoxin-1-like [Asterias rubens]|uniref:plancitoxin-1-like n=1 Tax=Asterias rubens TaxID=7604 RepID=UPI0014551278|nr:plancitoxin-1-like [Asterias rubens]XP_033643200.1 plancitoxin-1-like [Asterias rubens]